MDEIKAGEYIRTNKGTMGQIIEKRLGKFFKGKDDDEIPILRNVYELDTKQWTTDEYIVKHSKNIIDLIEVGDYVNGMRVIATENRGRYNEEKQKDEKVILAENYDEWTENGVISNEDIKSILTHEQFEQNCYKVGVENE